MSRDDTPSPDRDERYSDQFAARNRVSEKPQQSDRLPKDQAVRQEPHPPMLQKVQPCGPSSGAHMEFQDEPEQ